ANAATKLYRIIDNLFTIQGIELLNAAQAIEFRRPLKSSEYLENLFASFREKVPYVAEDTYLHPLIKRSKEFVQSL
ncbi:MAG: aromatic amino acid lyase, partial [Crocinitomicaceae bacterium]